MISPSYICNVQAANRPLIQSEIDRFKSPGVQHDTLNVPSPVRATRGEIQPNDLFDFASDGDDWGEPASASPASIRNEVSL